MINKVKVTDEEILALWEKTADAKEKAIKLMIEAEMVKSQAEYHKMLFWEAVGKRYGINVRSASWTYDEETQMVSRSKDDDEHPLAKLLSKGIAGFSFEPVDEKDKTGTVI